MNINKFNEARIGKKKPEIEDGITWEELIERIKTNDVILINSDVESLIVTLRGSGQQMDDYINYNRMYGNTLINPQGITQFYFNNGTGLIIIYDDDYLPEAIISIQSPMAVIFKHVVAVISSNRMLGQIILYDKITGKHEIKTFE